MDNSSRVPDALRETIEPLLPKESPKPNGGRSRVPDRAALGGIVLVLRTGCPWRLLPKEPGCGSGTTCWRRLRDWQEVRVLPVRTLACASGLRREVPRVDPVGQNRPQRLPVDDDVEADALRGGVVGAGTEAAVPERHERLLVLEAVGRDREDQPELPLPSHHSKIGRPRVVGAIVAREGVPFGRRVERGRTLVAVVDVPAGAVEQLDDFAPVRVAAEAEHEPIVRRMRDDEGVVFVIRFEHEAIAVVIQDQAVILGDEAERSGVAAIGARVGGRVVGERRVRRLERRRRRVAALRRPQ